MSHPSSEPTEYNPAADYTRFMQWAKYGAVIFILITLFLRFLIG